MTPLERARRSLDGLSVGDAFGEMFFLPASLAVEHIRRREAPFGSWRWTDDTEMAVSVVEVLREHGRIDQDALAEAFAARMSHGRGYGAGAQRILGAIQRGRPWREASSSAFAGQGSFGNGAAMRVAPLGAYFADDLDRCVDEARLSAEVTHAHPEGIAGAIAVAVAAALVWQHRRAPLAPRDLLEAVLARTPERLVRYRIEKSLELPESTTAGRAAEALGSGEDVAAFDTVPFCLWVAAHRQGRYEDGLWDTVSGVGDRDTTCAIVGGIRGATAEIPSAWLHRRERLPVSTV